MAAKAFVVGIFVCVLTCVDSFTLVNKLVWQMNRPPNDTKIWMSYIHKLMYNTIAYSPVSKFLKFIAKIMEKVRVLFEHSVTDDIKYFQREKYKNLYKHIVSDKKEWKYINLLKQENNNFLCPAQPLSVDDLHPCSVCKDLFCFPKSFNKGFSTCSRRRRGGGTFKTFTWSFQLHKALRLNVTFLKMIMPYFRDFNTHYYCHVQYSVEIVEIPADRYKNQAHVFCGQPSLFSHYPVSQKVKIIGNLHSPTPFAIHLFYQVTSFTKVRNIVPEAALKHKCLLHYLLSGAVTVEVHEIRVKQHKAICLFLSQQTSSDVQVFDGPSTKLQMKVMTNRKFCSSTFQCLIQLTRNWENNGNITFGEISVPSSEIFHSSTYPRLRNSIELCPPRSSIQCVTKISQKEMFLGLEILQYFYRGTPDYVCSFGGMSVFEIKNNTDNSILTLCKKTKLYSVVNPNFPKSIYSQGSQLLLSFYYYQALAEVEIHFRPFTHSCPAIHINPCIAKFVCEYLGDRQCTEYFNLHTIARNVTLHFDLRSLGAYNISLLGDGCTNIQLSTDIEYTVQTKRNISLNFTLLSQLQPLWNIFECKFRTKLLVPFNSFLDTHLKLSAFFNSIKNIFYFVVVLGIPDEITLVKLPRKDRLTCWNPRYAHWRHRCTVRLFAQRGIQVNVRSILNANQRILRDTRGDTGNAKNEILQHYIDTNRFSGTLVHFTVHAKVVNKFVEQGEVIPPFITKKFYEFINTLEHKSASFLDIRPKLGVFSSNLTHIVAVLDKPFNKKGHFIWEGQLMIDRQKRWAWIIQGQIKTMFVKVEKHILIAKWTRISQTACLKESRTVEKLSNVTVQDRLVRKIHVETVECVQRSTYFVHLFGYCEGAVCDEPLVSAIDAEHLCRTEARGHMPILHSRGEEEQFINIFKTITIPIEFVFLQIMVARDNKVRKLIDANFTHKTE